MAEQMNAETLQQKLQGAAPLLVSAAAAAAAGAIAVVARKALSGAGDGASRGGGSGKGAGGESRTSLDDVEKVADDLAKLVEELRSAGGQDEADFQRLTEIADTISEYADQAADAFNSRAGGDEDGEDSSRRVTEDLMSRIGELTGGSKKSGSGSSRPAAAASQA